MSLSNNLKRQIDWITEAISSQRILTEQEMKVQLAWLYILGYLFGSPEDIQRRIYNKLELICENNDAIQSYAEELKMRSTIKFSNNKPFEEMEDMEKFNEYN